VTAVHDNGMKEVWNIDGLLATAEHKVMTQHGWTRVDCLTQGVHNVFLYNEASWVSNQKARLQKRLYSTAGDIIATLKAITRRTADTLQGLAHGCIETFGFTATGRFPKGCTSTTLTGTPGTTTLQTLSAFQGTSIGRITHRLSASGEEPRNTWRTLSESGAKPQSGTDHQKDWNGTASTPRTLSGRPSLESLRKKLSTAFGAARTLFARVRVECIADQPAKQQSPNGVLVKQVTNTRTMRHVFDLTVEGEHCYYANGILVHNCTQAMRWLKDGGWLDIDPEPQYDDDDDYYDEKPRRINPYAV